MVTSGSQAKSLSDFQIINLQVSVKIIAYTVVHACPIYFIVSDLKLFTVQTTTVIRFKKKKSFFYIPASDDAGGI